MRIILPLVLILASSPTLAAEIAAPTVVADASTYTIVFHTDTVMEAAKRHDEAEKEAIQALGSISGVESTSAARKGGGFDVQYKFFK